MKRKPPKKDKSPAIQGEQPSPAIQKQSTQLSYTFQGPVPHPEVLEHYGRLVPNAPERILRLAETEADHRRSTEKRKLELAAAQVRRGQWFAIIFGLAALIDVGVAIYFHAPWVAGILGSGTILGVVTAFVLGRRSGSSRSQH